MIPQTIKCPPTVQTIKSTTTPAGYNDIEAGGDPRDSVRVPRHSTDQRRQHDLLDAVAAGGHGAPHFLRVRHVDGSRSAAAPAAAGAAGTALPGGAAPVHGHQRPAGPADRRHHLGLTRS